MPITSAPFGRTAAGEPVELYTLRNTNGLEARVMTYGGTLVSLLAPDRTGAVADVLLGFNELEGYLGQHPYFGSLVGRFANRIAKGRFSLDGQEYTLAVNNGANHLHGGPTGFHARVWKATVAGEHLGLSYVSAAGEEGYPGRLTVAVTYTLTDANELRIAYAARTDAPTVLNLTNHAYFNLGAADTILDHELHISADHFLPVDATQIPTGEVRAVEGTPMDFRQPTVIGARVNLDDEQIQGASAGYDHCYVFSRRGDLSSPLARVREPQSGRTLEVFTTQPAVQLYTGNFLEAIPVAGKAGQPYPKYGGFCLETQHFPDAPNQPSFPTTVLRPGERYYHTTIYTFGVEQSEA